MNDPRFAKKPTKVKKPPVKFSEALKERQADLTETFFALALGTPMPEHLGKNKPNLLMLREAMGHIAKRDKERVDMPFDVGAIRNMHDVTNLSTQVLRSFFAGEITHEMAHKMHKMIALHKDVVVAEVYGLELERLKMQQAKVIELSPKAKPGDAKMIAEKEGLIG